MQQQASAQFGTFAGFQSSSSPKAGCNFVLWHYCRQLRGSNPHPARKPDATPILMSCAKRLSSNPHPARKPDATKEQINRIKNGNMAFQSSSSPKAGCNGGVVVLLFAPKCSNPHPARKPDATAVISNPLISADLTKPSAILLFHTFSDRSIHRPK